METKRVAAQAAALLDQRLGAHGFARAPVRNTGNAQIQRLAALGA